DFVSAILDTVNSLVLVLDAEAKILHVNRAWEAMTGYTIDEVAGQFFWNYVQDRQSAKAFIESANTHNECEDYWILKGTARSRLVSWCCTTLRDDVGTGRHLVVTGRDITELRQRTEELEAFTYSVSHDMRAPVRAVDGFTRILIEEYADVLDD